MLLIEQRGHSFLCPETYVNYPLELDRSLYERSYFEKTSLMQFFQNDNARDFAHFGLGLR